jgi:hypothetical protein
MNGIVTSSCSLSVRNLPVSEMSFSGWSKFYSIEALFTECAFSYIVSLDFMNINADCY